jgi:aryl-alcohol dehydrogenase-like predicted oxidoreductase
MALDHGITHFDVARSYGYGLAEHGLRPFLKSHRNQVTIATKAGIRPRLKPNAARAIGPIARRVQSIRGLSPSTTRSIAGRSLDRLPFRSNDLNISLQTSLKNLRVDDVDVLFLHEPQPEDITDEVLTWLETVLASGLASRVGIATTQPPNESYASLPPHVIYQVAWQHLPQYRLLRLPVLSVHSIFREDLIAKDVALREASSERVVCVTSMYSGENLARNCEAINAMNTFD